MNIPFQAIDWDQIERTEHRGETGTSWWQTARFGGLRLRQVEYSPDYRADHWCRLGHIVHCLEGSFESELEDGRRIALSAGETYIVSDELSSHRSVSEAGVKLLIIDGDFLRYKGAGLLPDRMETSRLQLQPLHIDDAEFIRKLVNSEGWLRFIGQRNVHSHEDAVAYIQRILANPDITYHVLYRREDNIPVGVTTLIRRAHLGHPDIGFALLPDHEGRGYAFEAMQRVLASLQDSGTLEKVLAISRPDNKSSLRLLKKLGMEFRKAISEGGEPLHLFEKAIR
jgi:RimJ/RimL family protein N-acetyltransferase